MNVVTTYLYGDLNIEIYMKFLEGLMLPNANSSKPQNMLHLL